MDEKIFRKAIEDAYRKGLAMGKAQAERENAITLVKARLFDLETQLEKAETGNPYAELTDDELLRLYRGDDEQAKAVASYTLSERYQGDGEQLKKLLGGK